MKIAFNPLIENNKKHFTNAKNITPSLQNNFSFMHRACALALKNQILFTGDITRKAKLSLIKEFNKKYNLKISPEAFCYVIKTDDYKRKYEEFGSIFLRASATRYLTQKYPQNPNTITKILVDKYLNPDNLERVSKELFDSDLIDDNESTAFLNALMASIVFDGRDYGYKNLESFLNNHVFPIMKPQDLEIKEGFSGQIDKCILNQGKNPKDIHFELREDDDSIKYYNLYYKDLLLGQKKCENNGKPTTIEAQQLVQEVIEKIENKEISLDDATDNLPYIRYEIPNEKRIEELQELAKNLGLEFSDINLLHQVFLFRKMPDGSSSVGRIPAMCLAYLGQEVIRECLRIENFRNDTKLPDGISYETQTDIANKLNLRKYTLCDIDSENAKIPSRLFCALLGAIYLDNKEGGIEKAYEFLNKNFSQEVFKKTPRESIYFSSPLPSAKIYNLSHEKATQYILSGKNLVEVFMRSEFHKEFPHKTEGDIDILLHYKTKKDEYVSKISKKFFKGKIKVKANNLAEKFYAYLGSMLEKDGYRATLKFLDENIKPLLSFDDFLDDSIKNISVYDLFEEALEDLGYNCSDFQIVNSWNNCKIYYKNNKILTARYHNFNATEIEKAAIYELLQKIANHELIPEEYVGSEEEILDCAVLDEKRKEKLEELCERLNLKFNDINLLNRAFLSNITPEGQILPPYKTYQCLEYIGDAVINFCINEYINKNYSGMQKEEYHQKENIIKSNNNFIGLSEKLGLPELMVTYYQLDNMDKKTKADVLEALVGAIYLDGGLQGLDNAYKFVEENLGEDLFDIDKNFLFYQI